VYTPTHVLFRAHPLSSPYNLGNLSLVKFIIQEYIDKD
jgi:hypothetical protein